LGRLRKKNQLSVKESGNGEQEQNYLSEGSGKTNVRWKEYFLRNKSKKGDATKCSGRESQGEKGTPFPARHGPAKGRRVAKEEENLILSMAHPGKGGGGEGGNCLHGMGGRGNSFTTGGDRVLGPPLIKKSLSGQPSQEHGENGGHRGGKHTLTAKGRQFWNYAKSELISWSLQT